MEPTEPIFKSLLKWLQKISPNKSRNIQEVCDGVALLDALIQMAPDYFSKLEAKIKRDVSVNNWRLRVSNLKKILEAIVEYYQDVLTLQISETGLPDVVKIGEIQSQIELEKILRLCLGVAINCDKKQDYITTIMQMDEVVQRNMMQAIQQLEEITAGPGRSGMSLMIFETDTKITKLLNDLEASNKSREMLQEQVHNLEMQIQNLTDEKDEISRQNKFLIEKQNKNFEDAARKQIEQLKDDLFRAEVIRDDFKAKMLEQEKQILHLQEKVTELQLAQQDYARLKDEMDAMSESVSKVADLELMLNSYKKRLENYQDVKRNLQKLEEKNMEYLQKNMELEEELSKGRNWKTQCDAYKNKFVELQQKLDEESQKFDKAQFNLEKIKSKLTSVQNEKERLILERDVLREEIEDLKLGPKTKESSSVSRELTPNDLKEKLRFLERENRVLKNSKQESETKQAQLESLQAQNEKLQQKNRALNQTILKLENQIEEMKLQGESSSNNNSIIKEYRQKVLSLQEALLSKENELQLSKERYQKSVEKAREVAQLLDIELLGNRKVELFNKMSINVQRNDAQRGSAKFKSK